MKNKSIFFKAILRIAIIVLILAGINNLNAEMTRSQLQDMYVSYLRNEGYSPWIDSDGDVNFSVQRYRFYINVMDNDLQSFQIVLAGFLDIGGESNRLKALEEASAVTRTTRVVRLYITSTGRVAIDTYIFLARPEDFSVHLNRMVNIMLLARAEFLQRMNMQYSSPRKRPLKTPERTKEWLE